MNIAILRKEFKQWSNKEYCLKAVERNGYALQYVKEQSEAVCLKAVERNGDALRYVKEQSEAVCLKAVESDGYALQYVKEQSVFEEVIKKLKLEK